MMSNKYNLKPCPFCGDNEAKVRDMPPSDDINAYNVFVGCGYCGARACPKYSVGEAIVAWNRRAGDDE